MSEERNYSVTTERSEGAGSSAGGNGHAPKHMAEDRETPGSFVRSLLIDVIIALILASIVLYFIRPTVVKQTSMENTLHNNDYMIMYRQAYRSHDPQRGDIIIFQSSLYNEETGDEKLLIKRVIGLPGDEISIVDSRLYINGEFYPEEYLKDENYTPAREVPADGETVTVPEGCYFVMGDNRDGSTDSREYAVGFVDREAIRGKVVLRLFPITQIKRF